jgi:hypothetical protein
MIVAERQSCPGGQITSVCSFALGKIILVGGMGEGATWCYAEPKYVIAMANLTISVPFATSIIILI